MNNLTTEIAQILALREKNPLGYSNGSVLFQQSLETHHRPCYKRTLSDEPCSRRLVRDGASENGNFGNIMLSDLKETCEELAIEKSYEDKVECVMPLDLVCKKFELHSGQKRDSLESTESSEPISRCSSNDVCVVIVTDMDTCLLDPPSGPIASQTSGSSQTEDDVFMSQ